MALIKHHVFFILRGASGEATSVLSHGSRGGRRLGADGMRASNGILQQMATVRAMQTVDNVSLFPRHGIRGRLHPMSRLICTDLH